MLVKRFKKCLDGDSGFHDGGTRVSWGAGGRGVPLTPPTVGKLYYTSIPCYTILYYTMLHYTLQYYAILYNTTLYYTILHYTIWYYPVPHSLCPCISQPIGMVYVVPCKVIVLVISGPCEAGDQLEHFLRCSRYISHVRLGMDWVIVISPELTYFSADKQDYQVYWSDLNSLLVLCRLYHIIQCNVW